MSQSQEQSTTINEFLDIGVLNSLPSLEIKARYLVAGFLNGLHQSPYRGNSIEFKEFRDYQPGDPLKMIDWKVYGRTDRLHVRLHDDDTNMNVYLLLDNSLSMKYCSVKSKMSKWDYACSLTAGLMLFLHRQHDAFTLSLVGDGLDDYIHPNTKQSHFNELLAKLHHQPNAETCNWDKALQELSSKISKRSIVILISDFYTEITTLKNQLNQLNYLNCETLMFNVMDKSELDFDYENLMLLCDMETGQRLHVSPDLIRKSYQDELQKHLQELSNIANGCGGDYLLLKTDIPPLRALGKYLSIRSGFFK